MNQRKAFFLKEKPVKALITIRRNREEIYGSIISKKIDTTYAHTIKILGEMENEGLIKSEKDGRKKVLKLTNEGKDCADKFLELLDCLEQSKKLQQ